MDYELKWRKYDGTKIENATEYVREWADANPHGSIMIGCDSQPHTRYIKYSVTICMHMKDEYGIGHGAHVIFANIFDTNKSLKTDIYTKLWAEAEISVVAAQIAQAGLEDTKMKIMVHLDYNSNKERYSNVLYNGGIGFVKGMGFEAVGKPEAWGASHAADALCKNKQAKGVR